MGAYLSEPVVEKETEEGSIDRLKFSATRMQGWRVHQEDAHNCICDYSEGTSYFAVYDGHGGSEVSAYSAKHLPEFVKRMENWENGRHGQALRDAFLEFDKHLLSESALAELKILAGKDDEVNNNSDEEQEDRRLLIEESVLPLEQLLQKYGLRFRKSGTSPQSSSGGRCRKFLSPNVGRKKTKSVIKLNSDGVDSQTESSVASENKLPLNTFSQSIEEEDEEGQGQGPCTPPSSPDNSASEKKATKRSFPGNVERTTVVDLEPNRCSEKVSEDSLQVESVAKRLKVSRALEEEKITNTCESSTDSVNGFVPSGKKDSVESETVKESERGKNKTDIRRSVSEVSVAGSGSGSENDVNSKLAKRSNFVPAVDSDAVDMVGRQSHVTCHRHRSSKSESEVKILKMEDDSLGPVTNWKTIGPLSSDTDTPGRSTGTPETATAVSSSEDEEDSDDVEFKMDLNDSPDADDSDALDSSSSVDKSSVSDEEEEGESMEEGEVAGLEDMGGIELDPDNEDADMFPVPSGDTPGVDSGTTACVAVIRWDTVYVANAGDSRCVLCRKGKAIDLSVDHKPEDEEEKTRIENAGGKITADGRVNGGLNLSRAIGDHFYKKNDSLPLQEQMISANPDIHLEKLTNDDRFLVLACDGIWNSMSSQMVVDFISERLDKEIPLSKICEQICDYCLAPNTAGDGTGCDNMTVILVTFPAWDRVAEKSEAHLETSESRLTNGQ